MKDSTALTPRERIFCELIADHTDARSVGAKTKDAGYSNPKTGYSLLSRANISQEIERIVDGHIKIIRCQRAAVLTAVAKRAMADSSADARTFLQATGDISTGVNVQTNVISTNGEFKSRLKDEKEARERAYNRGRTILKDRT